MRGHTCLAPRQALYNVFVLPAALARYRNPTPYQAPLTRQIAYLDRKPSPRKKPSSPTARQVKEEPRKRHKWNDEITASSVVLVDPESNARRPPARLTDVLAALNLETHRLVQVTPDDPNDPFFTPFCRVVNIEERQQADRQRQAELKANKKASNIGSKTLELNWAIARNDLNHRLTRLKGFLEEGRKVEVVLASKKGGRRATLDECDEVIKRVRSTVDDVKGTTEPKAMDGRVGAFATLTFQGRPPSIVVSEPASSGG